MQKQKAYDTDSATAESGAPPTPRVSGEVHGPLPTDTPMPESSTRKAELPEAPGAAASEPTDTLLSAGKPADRLELLLEDRLAVVDERLQQLDLRLASLEQQRPTTTPLPAARQKPWLWLVFLIALAVVFQLVRALS